MRASPFFNIGVLLIFLVNTCGQIPAAQADTLILPKPGVRVGLSPEFNPIVLKGIKVHPENPFQFDFILDQGDTKNPSSPNAPASQVGDPEFKEQANKLIKYFLASLTTPEKDLWVNLSPYEKDRIVPESFGQTEMGRDLLAQDYLLKQITASLMYPEDEIGREFWKKIYKVAQEKYGTTEVPINTFNKVWIVPEKAIVYENSKAGTAYIVESRLKVMLEKDYLAEEKNTTPAKAPNQNAWQEEIIRDIIIPELTKEVNTGKNFAQLRQVYQSVILATWYKKKIKQSILQQVYLDMNKTSGININKLSINNSQSIYQQYVQAFKKGVTSIIREEQDPVTGNSIPRKYFSGGAQLFNIQIDTKNTLDPVSSLNDRAMLNMNVQLRIADKAMIEASDEEVRKTRNILSALLLKTEDHDWHNDLGQAKLMIGKSLGKTLTHGQIQFTVAPGYKNSIMLADGAIKGDQWVTVDSVAATKNTLNITLEFKKEGMLSYKKIFQIGRYKKQLTSRSRVAGDSTLDVLLVDEQIGLRGLTELVTFDSNNGWLSSNSRLPDLVGMNLGELPDSGAYWLNISNGFQYSWSPGGFSGKAKGWHGVIVSQRSKNNFIEFTVKFENESEAPIFKTFQIGQLVKNLYGSGVEKGKELKVNKISDVLGLDILKEVLVKEPTVFSRNKINLRGLRIGISNKDGSIDFKVNNMLYSWAILGNSVESADKEGWEVKIKSSIYRNNFIDLEVVCFKAGRSPIIKRFQITESQKTIKHQGKESYGQALSIESRAGIEAFKAIMERKPYPYSSLEGLTLGNCDPQGRIKFSFRAGAFSYVIYPLGFKEEGWSATIIRHTVTKDRHEVKLLLKKGKKSFQRTFWIGPDVEKIRNQQEEIEVLSFTEAKENKVQLLVDSIFVWGNEFPVPNNQLQIEEMRKELDRRLDEINRLRISLLLYQKSNLKINEEVVRKKSVLLQEICSVYYVFKQE